MLHEEVTGCSHAANATVVFRDGLELDSRRTVLPGLSGLSGLSGRRIHFRNDSAVRANAFCDGHENPECESRHRPAGRRHRRVDEGCRRWLKRAPSPARSRLVATAAIGAPRMARSDAPMNHAGRGIGNAEAQVRNLLSPGLFCRDDRI